jgi:hypothetical protein
LSFLAKRAGRAHYSRMDKERLTDAPYDPEESDAIIAELKADRPLVCPRCAGPLERGESTVTTISLFSVFIVRCPTCRRAIFAGEYFRREKEKPSGP